MIEHCLRVRALSSALAVIAFTAPASAASPRFDGTWTMTAVTTRGHCGTIPVGMIIRRGRISATSGSYAFYPISLSGRVSPSGSTSLRAVTGPRIARGTGRFRGFEAHGKWRGTGPSGVCYGDWTATRD
jgi:hypothetical protein